MSDLLDRVSSDFDRRMALRRRMLSHLQVSLSDGTAEAHRSDIRATLLGCGRCASPAACTRWLDASCPGTPMFCAARDAFLRLEVAARVSAPRTRARAC